MVCSGRVCTNLVRLKNVFPNRLSRSDRPRRILVDPQENSIENLSKMDYLMVFVDNKFTPRRKEFPNHKILSHTNSL
jgi:hypothetical protein